MSDSNVIKINWLDHLEGGFAAATVLVSFGVVIGKTTPMQLLGICIIGKCIFFTVPLFHTDIYSSSSLKPVISKMYLKTNNSKNCKPN